MKRIYFVVLMLLVCTSGFSQKVKIKKNIISIDDVEVGITEKYSNKEAQETGYTYSDLKGENKFSMVRYNLGEDKLYFVVRPDFRKDTAEIKMQYLYFTLNEQNALTDLLIKKYQFIDKNGINTNAINEYLSAERELQIPLILQRIQEEKRAAQNQKQAEEEQKRIVNNMNIRVANNGEITKGFSTGIGSFVPAPNPNMNISPDNRIIIKDKSGNIIAAVTSGGAAIDDFTAKILTYDKNTFEVRESYDKNNPTQFYQKIAEFLALKEYLEGQPNSYAVKKTEFDKVQAEATAAREAEVKEKTEVEGILTLKDGTKVEGTFLFNYRQTKEGKVAPEGSIVDLDAGKIIFYLYKDEKGKNKGKKYGVKEVATFYISDKEIYESVTYKKGNRLKEATSGGSLDVGKLLGSSKTQKFLLRVAMTDKARLYFCDGEYILMKPDSEDAITGKTLDSEDLAKFTSDCPGISQKAANKEYNNGGSSYIQLVEDYTKCN